MLALWPCTTGDRCLPDPSCDTGTLNLENLNPQTLKPEALNPEALNPKTINPATLSPNGHSISVMQESVPPPKAIA
jgi:hypothetical protein